MREEGGRTKEWWLPAYGLVAGVAPGGSVAGQERLLQGGGRCWWERLLDGGRRCWGLVPEAGQRRVQPAGRARGGGPAAVAAARNLSGPRLDVTSI